LLSISSYYTTVYGYEPTDTADPWKVYDVTAPPWVNDLSVLEFGKGYWINVAQSITLHLASGVSTLAASHLEAADTMPLPPATFYGEVLAGNSFTPAAGMQVTAWVLPDNVQCGQGQTRDIAGQTVYVVDVVGEDSGRWVGCGAPGRTIRFRVGTRHMATTAVWDIRQLWQLALSPEYRVYLPLILH
jgi:hypothetical protein